MSSPPPLSSIPIIVLTGLGSFVAGILGFAGTQLLTRSNEYIALLTDVRENREMIGDLAAKIDLKEREAIQALETASDALQGKRRAEGQSELLLNEIETLKWRQGIFIRIIQGLADRINMTMEERHTLFDELHMDAPPSLTTFRVTETTTSANMHSTRIETTTDTVEP